MINQYTIDNATSASEKSKATKAVTKYTKQLAEMKIYDEAIAYIANKRIEMDLDDGVKVNYAKFQGVEVTCKTAHCRRRKQQIIYDSSAPADCAVSVSTAV